MPRRAPKATSGAPIYFAIACLAFAFGWGACSTVHGAEQPADQKALREALREEYGPPPVYAAIESCSTLGARTFNITGELATAMTTFSLCVELVTGRALPDSSLRAFVEALAAGELR